MNLNADEFLRDIARMLQSPHRMLHSAICNKKIELCFDIIRYPIVWNEDKMCCFLFDLQHFPLERVVKRFEEDGGIIRLDSESILRVPRSPIYHLKMR